MRSRQARKTDSLPVQWDELTASDFPQAVKRAAGVCLLPIGVIEKHGPHLPLGTDVMAVRALAIGAAKREYAVVFPHYYFGQIYEARHQPGCITVGAGLMTALFQEICDEIARNGFARILIVNGHGGNNDWLRFFCQNQLARRRGYVVYVARHATDAELAKRIEKMRKTNWGGHACELETSGMLAIRPDLVKMDRIANESGRPLKRLRDLDAFTGMFWYADFPNHYAGDPKAANADLGKLALEAGVRGLAQVIRSVKRDKVTPALQEEFFARSEHPLSAAAQRRSKS